MQIKRKYFLLPFLFSVFLLLFIFSQKHLAETWLPVQSSSGLALGLQAWNSVASSDDGSVLLASWALSTTNGFVMISTSSGATWATSSAPGGKWYQTVDTDADGSVLIAGANGGRVYLSTSSGAVWNEVFPAGVAQNKNWNIVLSDADGSNLLATYTGGRMYLSTTTGATWSEVYPPGGTPANKNWVGVSSNSDGSRIMAPILWERVYLSTTTGATWFEVYPTGVAEDKYWNAGASDADGSNLIVAVNGGRVYKSDNYGTSWYQVYPTGFAENKAWNSLTSDDDGSTLLASVYGGRSYRSTDFGATWTQVYPTGIAQDIYWNASASDADGSNFMICSYGGYLYIIAYPTVTALSPADNATNVSVDTNLAVTFSTSSITAAAAKNIYIKKSSDNSIVETIAANNSSLVVISGADVTINPSVTLAGLTSYYIQIDSGAFQDGAGNTYSGITDTTTWNFTTQVTNMAPGTPTLSAVATSSLTINWTWGTGNETSYTLKRSVDNSSFSVVSSSIVTSTLTYNDIGLLPSTTYFYQVVATGGTGSDAISSVSNTTTPTVAPYGLVAIDAVSTSSLTLSWSTSTNPNYVQYVVVGGNSEVTTTGSSYTFAGTLTPSTSYSFLVKGVNFDGSYTESSNSIATTTLTAVPTDPVISGLSSSTLTLSWGDNNNPSSVYYQIVGGPTVVTSTAGATSTAISGLTPSTSYSFLVRTFNFNGSTTSDSNTTVTTTFAAVPSSPVLSNLSTSSLAVSWGKNNNPTSVYYQIIGGVSPVTTAANVTSTGLSGLTPNTLYNIGVKAANSDGSFTAAASTTGYTTAVVPGTPTATASSSSRIDLVWGSNSNSGSTVYDVSFSGGTFIATTTGVNYSVTGLSPNTSYQFKIRAQNLGDAVWTAFSSTSTATTTWAAPTVSSVSSGSISTSTVTLSGNITFVGVLGAASRGFVYGTSTNYGTTSTVSGSFTTGTYSSSISSLSSNTTYHYKAFAANAAGTAYGSDLTFTTIAAPSASSTSVVITSDNTATSTIQVSLDVTNATVDLSDLTSSNSTTLPGAIAATLETSLGTVEFDVPAETKITADASSSWDGTLVLPTVVASSSITNAADRGYNAIVSKVVEVGAGDTTLTLTKAARVLIPGAVGKLAGYSRGGVFSKITNYCSNDYQAIGDALSAGSECVIYSGNDLVIWTKHFTKFIAYTQTQQDSSIILPLPPKIKSAPVVSGATSGVVKSQEITLNLSASNAAFVAISEDQTFKGASWLPYAATKKFVLSNGNGKKIVYIKYRTEAGGESKVSSLKVTLASTGAVVVTPLVNPVNLDVVAPTASLKAVDTANYYIFKKNLCVGAKNDDVKELQKKLSLFGYLKVASITNYFGLTTKAAMIKFQKGSALKQTGCLDAKSMEKINQITKNEFLSQEAKKNELLAQQKIVSTTAGVVLNTSTSPTIDRSTTTVASGTVKGLKIEVKTSWWERLVEMFMSWWR